MEPIFYICYYKIRFRLDIKGYYIKKANSREPEAVRSGSGRYLPQSGRGVFLSDSLDGLSYKQTEYLEMRKFRVNTHTHTLASRVNL